MASEDTATSRVMLQQKQRLYSYCPRYQAPDTYLLHILTCPAISCLRLSADLLGKFENWLTTTKKHPDIKSCFILGLFKWFEDQSHSWTELSSIFKNEDSTNQAFRSQLSLGWFHTVCGFLSSSLIATQQTYFIDIRSRKSSRRWVT